MTLLADKAVVITGAASGLAAACSAVAAAEGALLVLADVNGAGLERTAAGLDPARCATVLCDVTDLHAARGLVEECVRLYGRIDGLVNAAGVMDTRDLLAIETEQYDRLFDVNVRALFFLMQAAARKMVEARAGSIVNFSSTAGRYPRPIASHYAASKAAVLSFTRSAAVALASDNVRVNCVCPGLIETPMIEAIRHARSAMLGTTPEAIQERWVGVVPMARLGTPEEVAQVVAFLLSDRASYVTGEAVGITGGTDAS